MIEPIKDN
jgi:hypothetical protein